MARYMITGELPRKVKINDERISKYDTIINSLIGKVDSFRIIVNLSIPETMIVKQQIHDINKTYGSKLVVLKVKEK